MRTVHTTTIVARCPRGGPDVYEAAFEVADRVLLVETINEAIADLIRTPIFQEPLTQGLADCLGCTVTTRGHHGQFQTTCTATPEAKAA